jgi:hypothetical protein
MENLKRSQHLPIKRVGVSEARAQLAEHKENAKLISEKLRWAEKDPARPAALFILRKEQNENSEKITNLARLILNETFAADIFALIIFFADDFLRPIEANSKSPLITFFNITRRLPLDLQEKIAQDCYQSSDNLIGTPAAIKAFTKLSRAFKANSNQ